MRIPKAEDFAEWTDEEGLSDQQLLVVIDEMDRGLKGNALGSNAYKKRVPLAGRGKRGGARTTIAYQSGSHAVFLVGLSKSERENIDRKELAAVRRIAREMLAYSEQGWERAIRSGTLIEVKDDG